ncbi:MAG: hypothetical protein SX243_23600 [Acidobacteriota bacterium]|nr:hypothetical protein [Acidobacteriota bacterium]
MPAQVIILDLLQAQHRRVYGAVASALGQHGVDFETRRWWSGWCAAADLVILADPLSLHRPAPSTRVLGQRTLTRRRRLEAVADSGMEIARWAAPQTAEELRSATGDWNGDGVVVKHDWSSQRQGVRFLPFAEIETWPPAGYDLERDVVMELLAEDPRTFKLDLFGGHLLAAWALETVDLRHSEFYRSTTLPIERFTVDAATRAAAEAASVALLAHGVGYASFDYMLSGGRLQLIEINSCGTGRNNPWELWPDLYAETYARAILATLDRLEEIPFYGELKPQVAASLERPPASSPQGYPLSDGL